MVKKKFALPLIIFIFLVIFQLAVFSADVSAASVTVTRERPQSFPADTWAEIRLVLDVDELNAPNSIIIDETFPAGWDIGVFSEPQYLRYDNETNTVSWLFWENGYPVADTNISYHVMRKEGDCEIGSSSGSDPMTGHISKYPTSYSYDDYYYNNDNYYDYYDYNNESNNNETNSSQNNTTVNDSSMDNYPYDNYPYDNYPYDNYPYDNYPYDDNYPYYDQPQDQIPNQTEPYNESDEYVNQTVDELPDIPLDDEDTVPTLPSECDFHGVWITANDSGVIIEAGFQSNIEYIDSCRFLDKENTEYILTNNIINPDVSAVCMKVNAPNIKLNCNGNMIVSDRSIVGVYSNQINTIISNCEIDVGPGSAGTGIFLENSRFSRVDNCVLNNQYIGLRLKNTERANINEIEANANAYGVYLENSHSNDLVNINANNNSMEGATQTCGIRLVYSNSNVIQNAYTAYNGYNGIDLFMGSNNIIRDSVSIQNKYDDGIRLYGGEKNMLDTITTKGNAENGILVWRSDSNEFNNIRASLNNRYGINVLPDSNDNKFNEAKLCLNEIMDFHCREDTDGSSGSDNVMDSVDACSDRWPVKGTYGNCMDILLTSPMTQMTAGQQAVFDFEYNEEADIQSVSLRSLNDVPAAQLIIENYPIEHEIVISSSAQDGLVYSSMDISFVAGSTDLGNNIRDVVIKFRVNNSWVIGNNIDPNEIKMKIFENGDWKELQTRLTSSNSGFHFYEAQANHLTEIMIVASQASQFSPFSGISFLLLLLMVGGLAAIFGVVELHKRSRL